jgi:D-alanyl-lipoteichoic acid acyltransferase DltB (MBOAT superfamily)
MIAAAWLGTSSLFFYAWWDYRYLPLLLISILFNYLLGWKISEVNIASKRRWLTTGIVCNLALLAYYKYALFFVSTFSEISGFSLAISQIALPIGISFFTFTQIAFLVDTYQGKVKECRFIHYLLFVTYFPHLIAGPVLHHKEMMPQFSAHRNYQINIINIAVGFSIFIIGLAKKVLIADNIAPYANDLFNHPASPSFFIAWGGLLAYTFQIYFDFSGYSDMAIGLSRIFGIRLPLNFNSPYKSVNIIDFWRRWHMTLSRFLRDYLYIPLGGNRYGTTRRHINLMVTMILGGLWHGAGWPFIIWGFLHGVYLIINHGWQAISKNFKNYSGSVAVTMIATLITFLAVCFSWVFFRATDLITANEILKGLIGAFGIGIPNAIGIQLGNVKSIFEQIGIEFYLGGGARFVETWIWVTVSALITFLLPNTQEIMRKFEPALDFDSSQESTSLIKETWMPNRAWAVTLGTVSILCLLSLNKPSDFLYFQF